MQTTAYQTVLVDVDDGVATITLNRPDRMNAYTFRMGLELRHAFHTLDQDDAIRAIVVTGAGKAFCAGADLESGGDTFAGRAADERARLAEELNVPEAHPWQLGTPIIAAINGAAVGVGITLPMQWDIRIAAEDAKIGFVFNRRGVIPEANSQWIVPRLVGVSRGLELLLTGRIITGREAAGIGLVSKAVPRHEVLAAAQDIAREISVNCAPVSVAITKKLVYRFLEEPDRNTAHALEGKMFWWTGKQADAREGVTAFLEKRAPDWKMGKTTDLPEELMNDSQPARRAAEKT
jgi:enoyl-CoA hydratase/carnithine racemase